MSDLPRLVAPPRTALIALEMQRGVVGDLASIPALAQAVADAELIPRLARLLERARTAGVTVAHCHASFRGDRQGTPGNIPMVNRLLENPNYLLSGSASVQSVPELAPVQTDLVLDRQHGISPFTGSELDALLRARGVETVVAVGVSLNVGIPGLVIEAVNHGHHAVVPADGSIGVPADYGQDVLRHSLATIATLTSCEALGEIWGRC